MPSVTTFNSLSTSGTEMSFTSCTAAAYTFANDGKVIVVVSDVGTAGTTTCTIATPGTFQGETITAVSFTAVGADGVKIAGPFAPEIFNDSGGLTSLTWNDTAAEFALVRIP